MDTINEIKLESLDDDEQFKAEFQNLDLSAPLAPSVEPSVAEDRASIDGDGGQPPSIKSTTTTSKNYKIRKSKNKVANVQKIDARAKLERSRQSARECRARKKLRYQYLEDLVNKREQANLLLKKEIEELEDVVKMLQSSRHTVEEINKRYAEI